jgi:L-amino acid N-acyltransferase YncA
MIARLATPDDFPEVMRLLRKFHVENGMAPLDPDRVAAAVSEMGADKALWVAQRGEALVGLLGIAENPIWYAAAQYRQLVDRFLYVEEGHRSSGVGRSLTSLATAEAERRGLPLFITVLNPTRAAKRARQKTLWGFLPVGWLTQLTRRD